MSDFVRVRECISARALLYHVSVFVLCEGQRQGLPHPMQEIHQG